MKELSLHSNLSGHCNPQINAHALPVCGLLLQNVYFRGTFSIRRVAGSQAWAGSCPAILSPFHLVFCGCIGNFSDCHVFYSTYFKTTFILQGHYTLK